MLVLEQILTVGRKIILFLTVLSIAPIQNQSEEEDKINNNNQSQTPNTTRPSSLIQIIIEFFTRIKCFKPNAQNISSIDIMHAIQTFVNSPNIGQADEVFASLMQKDQDKQRIVSNIKSNTSQPNNITQKEGQSFSHFMRNIFHREKFTQGKTEFINENYESFKGQNKEKSTNTPQKINSQNILNRSEAQQENATVISDDDKTISSGQTKEEEQGQDYSSNRRLIVKILQNMGWDGRGLGVRGQGTTEPLPASMKFDHKGIQ
ncbi:MAG: hypothetical protein EZS28_010511 [Streblomastix strix]|uniref:G-patch domain-containing protein n=1 Tax=Streblomastix strix TaxID=222440 RepID=A0A5J4WGD2_9EUKA|nr:MAG: hypothetical protein EZS28_010511 [Streblomastix strix]